MQLMVRNACETIERGDMRIAVLHPFPKEPYTTVILYQWKMNSTGELVWPT